MKLLLLLGFLVSINGFAQKAENKLPQCYVYTLVGTASKIKNGKTQLLKQNDYIFNDEIVEVKRASTLTLYDQSNKFIVIRQAGRYTYEKLQKIPDVKPNEEISKSYFNLIKEDFFSHSTHTSLSVRDFGIGGGAHRGNCLNDRFEPMDNSRFNDDTIHFAWNKAEIGAPYVFTLFDEKTNEIITLVVNDTTLDMIKNNLLKEGKTTYYWKAYPLKGIKEDCTCSFTIYSDEEKRNALKKIISPKLSAEPSFLDILTISNKLKDEGWYSEAYNYYINAKKLFK